MGSSLLPPTSNSLGLLVIATTAFCLLIPQPCLAITRHYHLSINLQNVTRLCHTKSIVTVNGKFPGPRIIAREGDQLLINVANHISNNISIHWHGIRQLQSGWADGPAYMTQCPIQKGQSYLYNYTITGQGVPFGGTLTFHGLGQQSMAHLSFSQRKVSLTHF